MRPLRSFSHVLLVCIVLSACTSIPSTAPSPPVLSTEVRDQIGVMAVRTPTTPPVHLTSALDTKGKAAGKTALAASAGWLGGTAGAAAETGDPFAGALVFAVGLIATPVVAVGGAVYGASAADTTSAIENGNATIEQTLKFAPQRLAHALEIQFESSLPVKHEFVGDLSNTELQARGYSTVLDIEMLGISSRPDKNQMHVTFDITSEASLTRVADHHRLVTRTHISNLGRGKAVSTWAARDGQALLATLDGEYARIAQELRDDFFLRPSVRVQGLAPVSRGFRTTKADSRQPTLKWSTVDGAETAEGDYLAYEVSIATRKNRNPQLIETTSQYYQPDTPLEPCTKYYWKVRSHYQVFGQSRSSDWSPLYRFKTACG